jgi:hypothetical protein
VAFSPCSEGFKGEARLSASSPWGLGLPPKPSELGVAPYVNWIVVGPHPPHLLYADLMGALRANATGLPPERKNLSPMLFAWPRPSRECGV